MTLRRIGTATLILVLLLFAGARAEDRFFESEGVTIRYIVKGRGAPVVLIHGFSRNIELNWVETGILDLSGTTKDRDVELVWTERGGPEIEPAEAVDGYGSKLLRKSVSNQLGGTISYDWSPEGVVVVLNLKGDRLAV